MGIGILIAMACGVALILSRKLPTAFALVLLAVVVSLIVGAPMTGKNSLFDTVLEDGSYMLASTMVAILLGSWLGELLGDTGIASTLVRRIVEFTGDKPLVVAIGMFGVSILVGSVTGSAPAALLAGIIGIPAMIAVGIPKTTAAGVILMGIAAGSPFELPSWQFFSSALNLPIPEVRSFLIRIFPVALVVGLAFVVIETRRTGTVHSWSVRTATESVQRSSARSKRLGNAPWYSLLAPVVPIVLALGFDLAIVPSLLCGVLYAVLTTTRPREMNRRLLRTLYSSFKVAAPPITLFIAIGILLAAVKLPKAISSLEPIVRDVSPHQPWLFVVVFTVLTPLCLFRGPLNIYGLGAGIASVLIAAGIYPAMAVLGLTATYNQVLGVADPTSTQTVWSAQYSGVSPTQVMARTLPYVWVVALGGMIITAASYL